MEWLSSLSSLFGGSEGGSSGLYSGQNSSGVTTSVSTPVTTTAGGGVNQNFNLGSLGIGNSVSSTPEWVWYVAAAIAAFVVWKKFK